MIKFRIKKEKRKLRTNTWLCQMVQMLTTFEKNYI